MQHNNTSKMLDVIRSYLSQQRKTKDYIPKSSYDDCILSLSEALKQVNLIGEKEPQGNMRFWQRLERRERPTPHSAIKLQEWRVSGTISIFFPRWFFQDPRMWNLFLICIPTPPKYLRKILPPRDGIGEIYRPREKDFIISFMRLASWQAAKGVTREQRRGNEKRIIVSSKCQLISNPSGGGRGGFAKRAKT